MHEPVSLEERVALLEDEVAALKHQITRPGTARSNWVDEMTGSMKDLPEFREVLRLGAEWRNAQAMHEEP